MAGSSNQRSRRAREAERQRAEAEARQAAYQRARRRQAAVGIGVVVAVVVAVAVAVVAATGDDDQRATTATTTTAAPTGPTVALPTVAPGATLTGPPPCPALDGSSPRTTRFTEPPPMCLDPDRAYDGVIETSEGTIHVGLNPSQYPQATNLFAFLAGYHYYDGLPVSRIVPAAYAEVDDPADESGAAGPGFSIPNEAAEQGPVLSPLTVALVPNADGTVGGAFLMGLTGQFAQIPPDAPLVATILDDRVDPDQPEPDPSVRQAISAASSPSGSPTEVITITRVTVTPR